MKEFTFTIKGWKYSKLAVAHYDYYKAKIRAIEWCYKNGCELVDPQLDLAIKNLLK